jgi:sugar/nucleoside kinase (ribokinase family)
MSDRSPRLAVIGHVCVDVRVRPFTGFPGRGQLVETEALEPAVGGAIGNVGRVVAVSGERAFTVCRVGRDAWGDLVIDSLNTWSDTRFVTRSDTAPTSGTIVFVDPDGERSFIHARGANAELSSEHIDLAALARLGVQHIHVGYALLLPALDGAPMVDLFRQATELGMSTSLDMTWDPDGRWMDAVAPLLPHVDLFCPNDIEAARLTGEQDPAAGARALIAAGVRRMAVVTCGAAGATVCTRSGEEFHVPAVRYDIALDATGAGDCFNAALILALLDGRPHREAVTRACEVAATALAARSHR